MAAIMTAQQLVDFAIKAKNDKWGYVYGAQGQMYSPELAKHWGAIGYAGQSMNYFIEECKQWFGHIVVDCSGLIIEAYRSVFPKHADLSANTLFATCTKTGGIASIPNAPGLCVHRTGHIGIYIGNGRVIEAGGHLKGVVETDIHYPATGKAWTGWGYLCDTGYGATEPVTPPVTPPAPAIPAMKRELRYRIIGMMKGDDVKLVQQTLIRFGFSCGSHGADGEYGKDTKAAVIQFQRAHKLEDDGIVGIKTWTALFNHK